MATTIKKKNIPTFYVVLFLILLAIKDFAGISVPIIVFTLIWVLVIIFTDESISAAFTLSSVICFASILSITIPCIVYLGVYILRHRTLKRVPILLVSIYIIVIEFLRLISNPGESLNLYVNSMAVLLLVYAVISEISEDRVDSTICIKYYLLFFAFLSLDIIWATARSLGSFLSIVSGGFRIGQVELLDETVTGIFSINANGIALMSMLAISLTMLLYNRKYLSNAIAIFLMIYYSIIGLLTVSKTFILVYVGFWCLYICWYSVTNNRNIFKTVALIIAFFVSVRILWNTDIVQNIIIRFNVNDLTTGRIDVAGEYLDFMRHNNVASVFGIGLQNVTGKTLLVHVPHNAVLEIFVCFGGIGIIAYIIFFISLITTGIYIQRRGDDTTHSSFMNLIPFIVFFIFIQSLQFLRINYIYASIAVAFAAMAVTGYGSRGVVK